MAIRTRKLATKARRQEEAWSTEQGAGKKTQVRDQKSVSVGWVETFCAGTHRDVIDGIASLDRCYTTVKKQGKQGSMEQAAWSQA
jgi:hypothetical protein